MQYAAWGAAIESAVKSKKSWKKGLKWFTEFKDHFRIRKNVGDQFWTLDWGDLDQIWIDITTASF